MLATAETTKLSHPGVFLWAVAGIVLLLSQAIFRMTTIALEPLLDGSLTQLQLVIYIGWSVSNLYLEGYRGFQLRFVPRVLARAHYLASQPEPSYRLAAPLFAMGYFHGTKRAVISAWAVTGLIIVAIVFVRSLAQPWRGIIDAGVVAGLSWGLVVLLLGAIKLLRGAPSSADPELPKSAP